MEKVIRDKQYGENEKYIGMGRITLFHPDKSCLFIQLDKPKYFPLLGYFKLDKDHNNYDTLSTTLLAAAMNQHPAVLIRTKDEILETEYAEIAYVELFFPGYFKQD